MDRIGPARLDPIDAIPAQAREIVADAEALAMTLAYLKAQRSSTPVEPVQRLLDLRLAEAGMTSTTFAITMIDLYFRMADLSDWHYVAVDTLSHPPAPFRPKALLAAFVEHHSAELGATTTESFVQNIRVSGEALMSVLLHTFPNLHWYDPVSSPEHDRHFETIHVEMRHWAGRMRDPSS